MKNSTLAVVLLATPGFCLAQEPGAAVVNGDTATDEEQVTGILALPNYAGDLATRTHLTGDWGGTRARLADQGVQFGLQWVHHYQSVEDGGLDDGGEYGASPTFLMNLDLQRMGLLPGATVTFRAESRYGKSINARTGQLIPANTDAVVPITSELDEDTTTITNLYYTQFLSETFGFLLGKFDNLESDFNEFASGRGTSQFLNANFVFTPTGLLEPYSTLGGALIWAPNDRVFAWSGLYNTTDSSTSSGFDDFGDGTSWFTELYVQHSIEDLPPGGFSLGAIYAFDNDFAKLNSTYLVLDPVAGPSLTPETTDDTWSVYGSLWQYLWTEEPSAGVIVNPQNHEIDLEGVGFFLRAGTADSDVNPIEWTMSGGLSGRGIIPSRDDDTFGLGYFYTSIQDSRIGNAIGLSDRSKGGEAYYSFALGQSSRFTMDVQVLDSPLPNVDSAVVLGARLSTSF